MWTYLYGTDDLCGFIICIVDLFICSLCIFVAIVILLMWCVSSLRPFITNKYAVNENQSKKLDSQLTSNVIQCGFKSPASHFLTEASEHGWQPWKKWLARRIDTRLNATWRIWLAAVVSMTFYAAFLSWRLQLQRHKMWMRTSIFKYRLRNLFRAFSTRVFLGALFSTKVNVSVLYNVRPGLGVQYGVHSPHTLIGCTSWRFIVLPAIRFVRSVIDE